MAEEIEAPEIADDGQARALEIAFNGGAVMGLSVAALGLLGLVPRLGYDADAFWFDLRPGAKVPAFATPALR